MPGDTRPPGYSVSGPRSALGLLLSRALSSAWVECDRTRSDRHGQRHRCCFQTCRTSTLTVTSRVGHLQTRLTPCPPNRGRVRTSPVQHAAEWAAAATRRRWRRLATVDVPMCDELGIEQTFERLVDLEASQAEGVGHALPAVEGRATPVGGEGEEYEHGRAVRPDLGEPARVQELSLEPTERSSRSALELGRGGSDDGGSASPTTNAADSPRPARTAGSPSTTCSSARCLSHRTGPAECSDTTGSVRTSLLPKRARYARIRAGFQLQEPEGVPHASLVSRAPSPFPRRDSTGADRATTSAS